MAIETDGEITLNKLEARQGSTRPKLIYVLVIGVALVVVAFVSVAMFTH